MAVVIGVDLGNYNTYVSFIQDLDIANSRLGGRVQDLVPPQFKNGIPSLFLYSPDLEKRGIQMPAVGGAAETVPVRYRHLQIRYLKEHIDEDLLIDGKKVIIRGKTYTYNQAIQDLMKYIVDQANIILEKNYGVTTNLVSLAYPANFSSAKRMRLIELLNQVTLANNQKLKVFGTISEPAAANLDYLADHPDKVKESQTALVYDLGAGTFDISMVTSYPHGRKNAHGDISYYHIEKEDGIQKIGGKYYTDVVYDMLLKELAKQNVKPRNSNEEAQLMSVAEDIKQRLTDEELYTDDLQIGGEWYEMTIKRSDFEKQTAKLLEPTINMVKAFINDSNMPDPEMILLTGGASQMPVIRTTLEKELPHYKDRIIFHRPTMAISYGAARYGCAEANVDVNTSSKTVTKKVTYSIGDCVYYYGTDDEYIRIYIPEGTELPYESEWKSALTRGEDWETIGNFVMEGIKHDPDVDRPYEDFHEIGRLTVEFGRKVPRGTAIETRMILDEQGILHIESRPEDNPDRLYNTTIALKIDD